MSTPLNSPMAASLPMTATPCDCIPCDCIPCDCMPCDCIPCDCMPCDCIPCDCIPCDCIPCDCIPCDCMPCDCMPCDCIPCDCIPCDCMPCDCIPATAAPGTTRSMNRPARRRAADLCVLLVGMVFLRAKRRHGVPWSRPLLSREQVRDSCSGTRRHRRSSLHRESPFRRPSATTRSAPRRCRPGHPPRTGCAKPGATDTASGPVR